jgi:hypothetical protein
MRKIFLITIIALAMTITGCNTPDSGYEKEFNFEQQTALYMTDDGWLYSMTVQYFEDDCTPGAYEFNADNMKHQVLEGFRISVIDSVTGETLQYIMPSLPHLHLDRRFGDEIDAIGAFFENQRPNTVLSVADLDDLTLEYIDKNLLVGLFNQAITSDMLPAGRYYYLPFVALVQDSLSDSYQWQVSYHIARGNIVFVRIDVLYDDGRLLSDIIETGEPNEKIVATWNEIIALETTIQEQNNFIQPNLVDFHENSVDFGRLLALLESIHNGEAWIEEE